MSGLPAPACSFFCVPPLSALLDAQQHRAVHDQVSRLKQEIQEAQRCGPARTAACAQQQPRPAVVGSVEDKLPRSGYRACRGARARVENEVPAPLQLHYPGPHAPSGVTRGREGNNVAYCEVLPLRVDPICVGHAQMEQPVLNPRVRVQPSPVNPHLHQPRPDLLGRRGDGHCHRLHGPGFRDQVIAWKGHTYF